MPRKRSSAVCEANFFGIGRIFPGILAFAQVRQLIPREAFTMRDNTAIGDARQILSTICCDQ